MIKSDNDRSSEILETYLFLQTIQKGRVVGGVFVSEEKIQRKEMKIKEIRRIRAERKMFGLY